MVKLYDDIQSFEVVANGTGYCIRGYNTRITKNSISNTAIRESTLDICNTLDALAAASGSQGLLLALALSNIATDSN